MGLAAFEGDFRLAVEVGRLDAEIVAALLGADVHRPLARALDVLAPGHDVASARRRKDDLALPDRVGEGEDAPLLPETEEVAAGPFGDSPLLPDVRDVAGKVAVGLVAAAVDAGEGQLVAVRHGEIRVIALTVAEGRVADVARREAEAEPVVAQRDPVGEDEVAVRVFADFLAGLQHQGDGSLRALDADALDVKERVACRRMEGRLVLHRQAERAAAAAPGGVGGGARAAEPGPEQGHAAVDEVARPGNGHVPHLREEEERMLVAREAAVGHVGAAELDGAEAVGVLEVDDRLSVLVGAETDAAVCAETRVELFDGGRRSEKDCGQGRDKQGYLHLDSAPSCLTSTEIIS